jgi:hypothetical protein
MYGGTVGSVMKTSGKGRRRREEKNLGEGKRGRKNIMTRYEKGRYTREEAKGNGSNVARGRGHATGRTRGEGGKVLGRGYEGSGNRARVAEKTESGAMLRIRIRDPVPF